MIIWLLRVVSKLSRDVIDFKANANMFHSNGAAYLIVRDPYDFSLNEGTTKIIRFLDLIVILF